MRRLLYSCLFALMASSSVAQELVIRDVFRQMPDSLMPYLSTNNRLDFIDFLDSKMKAEIKNQFDGKSEMTALTDDSLSIRMNDALRVDMLKTDSVYGDKSIKFFTPQWQQIRRDIPWNDIQRKRINSLGLQNILKWDEETINRG